ncbi:MAG: hypothetical protein M1834_005939 [Cirrosporium novae-zelandiae]|nr:MAG: hypothetical protein M1834_005939 [Cirrosporium novae-zelandiae]
MHETSNPYSALLQPPQDYYQGDVSKRDVQPGYILFIKKRERIETRYFEESGIDEGGLRHPCLVIAKPNKDNRVAILPMTSFGSQTVQERYPRKKDKWKLQNFIPIHPRGLHDPWHVELRTRIPNALKVAGYVNIQRVYQVHISMLRLYEWDNPAGYYALDEQSLLFVFKTLKCHPSTRKPIQGLGTILLDPPTTTTSVVAAKLPPRTTHNYTTYTPVVSPTTQEYYHHPPSATTREPPPPSQPPSYNTNTPYYTTTTTTNYHQPRRNPTSLWSSSSRTLEEQQQQSATTRPLLGHLHGEEEDQTSSSPSDSTSCNPFFLVLIVVVVVVVVSMNV